MYLHQEHFPIRSTPKDTTVILTSREHTWRGLQRCYLGWVLGIVLGLVSGLHYGLFQTYRELQTSDHVSSRNPRYPSSFIPECATSLVENHSTNPSTCTLPDQASVYPAIEWKRKHGPTLWTILKPFDSNKYYVPEVDLDPNSQRFPEMLLLTCSQWKLSTATDSRKAQTHH